MEFENALKLINRGKCILFTGSGFSFGATNMRKNSDGTFAEFSGARKLASALAGLAGITISETDSLGDIAEYVQNKVSQTKIIELLKTEFSHTSISASHKLIGSLPWRRCYTTNYDEILEEAQKQAGIQREVVTMSTPVKDIPRRKTACVHINGAISKLTPETLNNEFKLTRRSYLSDDLLYSPWMTLFKEDLRSADAVFFIGFSGDYDLDLNRIFESTRELKEKSFFIVHPDEKKKPISISKLENFGKVLPIGTEGFANEYQENIDNTVVSQVEAAMHELKCFREPVTDTQPHNVKAANFKSLLTRGRIDYDLLNNSVREPEKFAYIIFREKIDEIVAEIKSGRRNHAVVSRLGNGKTIFLESLGVKLKREGFGVYFFEKYGSYIDDEIDEIMSRDESPVFIFDSYSDNIEIIKKLYNCSRKDISIIVSERTPVYEITYHRLGKLIESLNIINIDKLTDSEVQALINLYNRYGLWKGFANFTPDEKKEFISRRCKGNLSHVLLSTLEETHQLESSYSKLIDAIKNQSQYYDAVIFTLLLVYFNKQVDYESLLDLIGPRVMNNAAFKHNPSIKELIDFSSERVTFTSAILAKYILTKQIKQKVLEEFYVTKLIELDARSGSREVRKVIRKLLQYRELSGLGIHNSRICKMYEQISGAPFCQSEPLFWLQYAMARTVTEEFDLALDCFQTANSLARKKAFDTFQIDNHYAHFLLKRAMKNKDLDTRRPYEIFNEAHNKLILRKKGDESRHFIYKVALDYKPFWDKYHPSFSEEEKAEFVEACEQISDMANEYLGRKNVSEKLMVEKLIKQLGRIGIDS